MEILQRREAWIHTHFVTDCVRLSHTQGREIEAALLPVLRQHHLVYGIHFEASRHDPGIRVVLECIPLRRVLDQIETALRHILAPIPAKPAAVQTVTVEPRILTPEAARPASAPSPSGHLARTSAQSTGSHAGEGLTPVSPGVERDRQ